MKKDEKYLALIEEIQAALTEGSFTHRWSLVETYHAIGTEIVRVVKEEEYNVTDLIKEVAKDINRVDKVVWDAYRVVQKYPDINSLPFVKSASWTKIRREVLGDNKKPEFNAERIAKHLIKKYGEEKAKEIGGCLN